MTINNNNKMKTYYIGTRAKWNDIGDVLGRDDVARLIQGLSKSIRTSVMKSGIKKTEQGARLEFYSVSNDEFDKLMKEQDTRVRPLVRVDEELLNKTLTDVNNKYGGRMDYDTHKKYKIELAEGFDKCVEIIGDDLNTRKKPTTFKGKNPYKVGDWIRKYDGYSSSYNCRITRTSDKSVWVEVPLLNGCSWREGGFLEAQRICKNVIGWEEDIYRQEYEWAVPYEGNEEHFIFKDVKKPIRLSNYSPRIIKQDKYENTTPCYVRGYYTERTSW
jgi:hypothetical protein